MTELEKIAFAKSYVEKLANGINPLTGQAVPDTDIINNVKISRCLFYVADIIRQVLENGGTSQRKGKVAKMPFQLDYQARKAFRYSEEPIPISEITRRINELIAPEKMLKLSYKHILDWLIEIGLLTVAYDITGKTIRCPTASGLGLGITNEQRQSARGIYTVTLYSKAAQAFIVDNLDAVIERRQIPKKAE